MLSVCTFENRKLVVSTGVDGSVEVESQDVVRAAKRAIPMIMKICSVVFIQ
jgi:hypothetical protein